MIIIEYLGLNRLLYYILTPSHIFLYYFFTNICKRAKKISDKKQSFRLKSLAKSTSTTFYKSYSKDSKQVRF